MGEKRGLTVRYMTLDDADVERGVDDNPRLHRITIFKNERARSGPELALEGLSTDDYERNPIVAFAHRTDDIPIGRTEKLNRSAKAIKADFTFLPDDPIAARVENAWNHGYIQAASVAWLTLETERIKGEDADPFTGQGYRDTRSNLLEWSLVPVPADAEALRAAKRRQFLREIEGGDDQDTFTAEQIEAVREIVGAYIREDEARDYIRAIALDAQAQADEDNESGIGDPPDEERDLSGVKAALDTLRQTLGMSK